MHDAHVHVRGDFIDRRGRGSSVGGRHDVLLRSENVRRCDGKPADLGDFRGKVTLVVNVASKCGFTPQYEGLEKLHRELCDKGFAVLGFPSNDFGEQEPGTAQEIAQFCKLTYDVTFPMFSKVVTKAGRGPVPDLQVSRRIGPPAGVELQQVRHRQGRQGPSRSSRARSRRRIPSCAARLPTQ